MDYNEIISAENDLQREKEKELDRMRECQQKTLLQLRGCYYFDALEKLLHQSSMAMLSVRLEGVLLDAKIKNPNGDYSEQEKLLSVVNQAARWMDGLYARYSEQNTLLRDMEILNYQLSESNKMLKDRKDF